MAIIDVHSRSAVRTTALTHCPEHHVHMLAVQRGSWTVSGPHDRDKSTVSVGRFILRHFRHLALAETAPHTTAKVLGLPSETFTPLFRKRGIAGATNTAEMRLLLAHANMVQATMADLHPVGVHAARGTLVELAIAVVLGRVDDSEPLLGPALAQAAKGIANSRLADPELSPAMLARELKISVRTLQRAFAATGESVNTYVRHRRLDEARRALSTLSGHSRVSEVAAHWQFADSSHFTREFKKRFGRTPTDYARSTEPAEH
ncbi:helix-turn-helix domain-containing protein [Umezawaea endophytica]|uniref:Helix-turn-helix domain-containing protein n=1 Tax=Umezawaea endophytica TaxID=1654476 RepID=A0A9X2VVL5_9PSEU|nr:helix-turn-helix domain-containing protein [Umezawaea endophytica]MCS7482874.1 helix-turn-helix domain-containing protein [Umezawaea endophytica]